jgi:quaternary ammonium compound-resistance protein SugE
MAWIYLIIAGALECVWSTFMKMSDGFSRPLFTILTIAGLAASMAALVAAVKTLPLGLAYPVWTGIGAAGSVLIGVLVFKDQLPPLAWFFLILLIVSVIGLQAASAK